MNLKKLNEKLEQLLEMSMYENPRKNFADFQQYVLNNPQAKKTYFLFEDLKIPSDTIIHVQKRHKLNHKQWDICLQAYSKGSILNQNTSTKTRYDGNAIKYLYEYNNQYIGMVIEHLKNKDKILTTAFIDTQNGINNWVNS